MNGIRVQRPVFDRVIDPIRAVHTDAGQSSRADFMV
jgi:hypothetical protein